MRRADALMTSYNMELYNIIPQHNLSFYMMSRGPGTTADGQSQALGVDTFRFEALSNSASKGFTVRIPGRDISATPNGNDDFRWDPENAYPSNADQTPSMRNVVALDPLNYPQSTAYAYDLNELSWSGNESAPTASKDCERNSNEFSSIENVPTKIVRIGRKNSALHEKVPRSESKLRSIQKLKQLSLEDKFRRKTS